MSDNNIFGPNTVSAYSVGPDCSLTLINTYPTGGIGGGGPIGTNYIEVCGNNVYAANFTTSTITDRDVRNNPCQCAPLSDTMLPR